MLYSAKGNEKYTDLAKYFDENFYSDKRNDEKCYRAMYLIYYMLACKSSYFKSYEEYDRFAQTATSSIYMRFLKKWHNGERIKSVLNYAKSTVYPLKVMYQKLEYYDVKDLNAEDPTLGMSCKIHLRENVQREYMEGLEDAVIDCFKSVPKIVDNILDETPYKNDTLTRRRLYISCLISLAKSITLNEQLETRLEGKINNNVNISVNNLGKIFGREKENAITLWRLDETMTDYVELLFNKIRKKLADEINEAEKYFELPVDMLDDILDSANDTDNDNTYIED